jgi:hypothetical protein
MVAGHRLDQAFNKFLAELLDDLEYPWPAALLND